MEVLRATWPAARSEQAGPVTLNDGQGGGQRVSAVYMARPLSQNEVQVAAKRARALNGRAIFQVVGDEDPTDEILGRAGFEVSDPTLLMTAPIKGELAAAIPNMTAFNTWPPLQIMREIWAANGINENRMAVMERASGLKTALLGRIKNRPAGVGFAAIHDRTVMLHALAVSEEFRGLGLGANLTCAAAQWGQEHGATELSLAVVQANTGAVSLYQRLGLEVVGGYHYRVESKPNTQER